MRNFIFALTTTALVAVAMAGCSSSTTKKVDVNADMTMANVVPDMAMAQPDMAGYGCVGFESCWSDCINGGSMTFSQCDKSCSMGARGPALSMDPFSKQGQEFVNALSCGQEFCLGDVDAGTGACQIQMQPSGGGTLVDGNGQMAGACAACLNDSTAALFGNTCMDMNGPNCNPSVCKSLVNTCLNDTP